MRSFRKSWQNKRPGWTHRVKWFESYTDIRLALETPDGKTNVVFDIADQEKAQHAYDAFRLEHGETKS